MRTYEGIATRRELVAVLSDPKFVPAEDSRPVPSPSAGTGNQAGRSRSLRFETRTGNLFAERQVAYAARRAHLRLSFRSSFTDARYATLDFYFDFR